MTAIEMTAVDMSAKHSATRSASSPKLELLDSLTMSRCRLRGKETQMVTRKMTILLSTRRRRIACSDVEGMTMPMTWGMVSPLRGVSLAAVTDEEAHMMTLNAHMLQPVSSSPTLTR